MYFAQPVYRPLSEAQSLLVQATVGCSQPTCSFCLVSESRSFRVRPLQDIKADMDEAADLMAAEVESLFFLAGDAFVMRARDLSTLADHAYRIFPNLKRISAYATAKDIDRKSTAELKAIRSSGFNQLYVGVDSGNDEVLRRVNKGNDRNGIIAGCGKAIDSGFVLSVTAILGLGGAELTVQHAVDTASAMSEIEPHYFGLVTLMSFESTGMGRAVSAGRMKLLNAEQSIRELELIVGGIDVKRRECVFRSNHPSNYVALLAGTFPQDRLSLLEAIARSEKSGTGARHPIQRTL